MKNLKKIWFTMTCIVLAVVMCFSAACASFQNDHDEIDVPGGVEEGIPEEPSAPSEDTEQEPSVDEPIHGDDPSDEGLSGNEDNPSDNPSGEEEVPSIPEEDLFEEYELDDAEGFVYSLLYSDLQQQYDTFAGYISLSDSSEEDVYGIAYTDLSEAYEDNSGKTYFSSGFLSFSGEEEISASLREKGLKIHSLEEDDDLYSYIYTYDTEPVHGHCVVYGKYVQYDIDNVGQITYTEQEYSTGMSVDSSRGNLYSYDEQTYVYIVEEQDYVPVFGVSLLGEADYEQIIAEADRLLKTQEVNFSYSEIESYVSYSMEALNSYLLGLQEETFMGIPTEDLIEIAKNLDPLQHLRIEVDENGAITIQLIEVTKLPTFWEKALTSIVCAVAVVGGFVIGAVGKTIPGLGALGGALVGAGIEAFSQVVINNTPVSDIQWAQVGVAAISGAISGAIGVKLNTSTAFQGASRVVLKETTDTLCDSLIGGGEFFVNSLIAGYSFEGACKNFGYGLVAGAVISGGVKLATGAVKSVAGLIKRADNISIEGNKYYLIDPDIADDLATNKVIRSEAKNAAFDTAEEISEDLYSKTLKRNPTNPKLYYEISTDTLTKAKRYMMRVSDEVPLSIKDGSPYLTKHLDAFRQPRPQFMNNVWKADSSFLNADISTIKHYINEDLAHCDVYLREKPVVLPGDVTRYIYDISNSLHLTGKDLTGHFPGAFHDYRLIIDVYADDTIKIFNAYPIPYVGF